MENLKTGKTVTIIGKYDKLKNTVIASDVRLEKLPEVPRIESIYYTTSGLSKKSISKYIMSLLMSGYKPKERLPEYLVDKYNLLSKKDSISVSS